MRQGSSVTYTVQPESRQRSSSRAACLSAINSGMPCRVMIDLSTVMPPGNDFTIVGDDSPDGYLTE